MVTVVCSGMVVEGDSAAAIVPLPAIIEIYILRYISDASSGIKNIFHFCVFGFYYQQNY